MAFAVSGGTVRAIQRPTRPASYEVQVAPDLTLTYAEIYRRQPEVRTVIDFLARNIAQLSLHTFRREGETNRARLRDHPLAQLLGRPNATTTPYRMMRALVADRGIYDVAYWLKTSDEQTGSPALIRMPPWKMKPDGDDWLDPERFIIKGDRGTTTVKLAETVYFRGYNPVDPRVGLSPMESLRRILSESYEASRMREQVLRNGARLGGYITRPKDAGEWDDNARARFKDGWRSQFLGATAEQAGGTPVLEDGMEFIPAASNAVELQYVEARKLTREEVAASFHIPPPMVGILDHATFGNIEEQHKMLYQDTLGPWLEEIQQEISLQLIPDFDDTAGVYVEFNLRAKMDGSFTDQAAAYQTAVGAPYMTRNEIRARENLPALDGGDELVTPLNVLVGGQASAQDSGSQNRNSSSAATAKAARVSVKSSEVQTEGYERTAAAVLDHFFERQRKAIRSRLGAKDDEWWDEERWNSELSDDLYALAVTTATQIGRDQATQLGFAADDYDEGRTLRFLRAVADSRAGAVNSTTRDRIRKALNADTDTTVDDVFDEAVSQRSGAGAAALIAGIAGFAVMEVGKQLVGDRATKTWNVTSQNPRASHIAVDGETVGINETFSNGMLWPGDSAGGADEVAGCQCGLTMSF